MKTYDELRKAAADEELQDAARAYSRARQNLDYVSVHGNDDEFDKAFKLTEMTRNNFNWLRAVRS